jgi:hypothetical protein
MIENEYSLIMNDLIYSDAGVYYAALATPNQTAISHLRMSYYDKEASTYYALIGLYTVAILSEEFQFELSNKNKVLISCDEQYLLRAYLNPNETTFEWYASHGRLDLSNASHIYLENHDEIYLCALRQFSTNKLWYMKLIKVKKVLDFWMSISQSVRLAIFLITISIAALIMLVFAQFVESNYEKMSRKY